MSRSKYKRPYANTKLTPALKEQIVAELTKCFAPCTVAHNAGISHETYRRHYNDDPEFRKAVDEARLAYAHRLRQAVHRRAVIGFTEKHFDAKTGQLVRTVRKFSDSLMLRHIARFDPSYRESTKVEQKTTLTASVELQKDKVKQLSPEEQAALVALVKARRAKRAAETPANDDA